MITAQEILAMLKDMRYLITTNNSPVFLTKYYDPEKDFNIELEMVVYDLVNFIYTKDGVNWEEIMLD